MKLWALIDADGRLVSYGACCASDYELQPTPEGLTRVERHQDVTGVNWRYVDGEWSKET